MTHHKAPNAAEQTNNSLFGVVIVPKLKNYKLKRYFATKKGKFTLNSI